MSKGASSSKLPALFVALPILGPLFFFVPWEADPRVERPEQRLQRLRDPRQSYLVDVVANLQLEFVDHDFEAGLNHTGLFSWQLAERDRLEARLKPPVPKVPPPAPPPETPAEPLAERLKKLVAPAAVELLLKEGGDPNTILNGGVTPLVAAISVVNLEEVKALLDKGADPNGKGESGGTPLKALVERCEYKAATREYSKCVEENYGNATPCIGDKERIALSRTKDVRLLAFAEALLKKGANPRTVIPKEDVPLEGANDQPRAVGLLEYAGRYCPDFVINAISPGNKPAPMKPDEPKR